MRIAINIRPDDSRAHKVKGIIETLLGKVEEARSTLTSGREMFPEDRQFLSLIQGLSAYSN